MHLGYVISVIMCGTLQMALFQRIIYVETAVRDLLELSSNFFFAILTSSCYADILDAVVHSTCRDAAVTCMPCSKPQAPFAMPCIDYKGNLSLLLSMISTCSLHSLSSHNCRHFSIENIKNS